LWSHHLMLQRPRLLILTMLLMTGCVLGWPSHDAQAQESQQDPQIDSGPIHRGPTLSDVWGPPKMPPEPKDFGPHFDFPSGGSQNLTCGPLGVAIFLWCSVRGPGSALIGKIMCLPRRRLAAASTTSGRQTQSVRTGASYPSNRDGVPSSRPTNSRRDWAIIADVRGDADTYFWRSSIL
jgi:hypothetical protein